VLAMKAATPIQNNIQVKVTVD